MPTDLPAGRTDAGIALPPLDAVVDLARRAGEAIMALYGPGVERWTKAAESSVTAANLAAHEVLARRLAALTPDLPVIREEAVTEAGLVAGAPAITFWLVDLLDGTCEFLLRNGEFTVNVALVVDGHPVAGVVGVPATGRIYNSCPDEAMVVEADGSCRPIRVRAVPADGPVALISRSHLDPRTRDWLTAHEVERSRQAGSSLRFCMIAEGEADLYPRLGCTMEWDIAAGHAVLLAASGHVDTLADPPLTYGKPGLKNPHFLARGSWTMGEAADA